MEDIQNQMQGTQEEIVRCPNFMLCYSSHPQWVADCNHGVCMNCAVSFAGRLEFINKLEECSICHERKEIFIKFQQCTHYTCCQCFRKCAGWRTEEELEAEVDDEPFHHGNVRLISPPESEDNAEDEEENNENSGCPFCGRSFINHWEPPNGWE